MLDGQVTLPSNTFTFRCTLKRELPAIPLSAQPDPAGPECNVERTQSQHSSDLYAAVGDVDGKYKN